MKDWSSEDLEYSNKACQKAPVEEKQGLPLRITGYYFRFSEITDPEWSMHYVL